MKYLIIFASALFLLASFVFVALASAGVAEVKATLARRSRTGR